MSGYAKRTRTCLRPLLLMGLGLVLLFSCIPTLVRLPNMWPPAFLERKTQRKQVLERVHSAGGWSALLHDCDTLSQQTTYNYFLWVPWSTNALPLAIAALKPREVRAGLTVNPGSTSEVRIVHVKVFGFRSTDGHQPPYFGLEIVLGPGAETYKQEKSKYLRLKCELLANNIYEVHE